MKTRLLWLASIVFLGTILSFCSYTPDESIFKKIEEIDPKDFTIHLDSYPTDDTIYLNGPRQFTYSVGSGNGHVREIRVLLNNSLLATHTNPGSFIVTPQTGIYQLKIEFVSTSGTGSLADQSDGEFVEVWKTWIIKAYVETPPSAPEITVSIVNGYSVITWVPYTKTRFVHYRVEIDNDFSYYITDPGVTTLVDSIYTGHHDRTYRVFTKNEVATIGSSKTLYGSNNLDIRASFDTRDSTIKVDLPKPIYYATFTSYSITEDGVEVGQITDPHQTTYTFKPKKVGIDYSVGLSVVRHPKHPATAQAYWNNTLSTSIAVQRLSRSIQRFTYNNKLHSIIGFWGSGDQGKIFTIDPVTFALTDSIQVFNGPGYHVPYDGGFVYYSNPNKLTQVNLATHEEKSINAITSTYGSGPSSISASQSQIISYSWFGPGGGNVPIIYYSRLYNMETDQTISEIQRPNSSTTYRISDDGKFVRTVDNEILKILGGSLVNVGTLSFTGTWLGFRQDRCEEILIQAGQNNILIYDTNTLALKRSVTVSVSPEAHFVTYDLATKCLIFNNPGTMKLYSVDIDTGNTKEFNVNASGFSFINGTIIMNSKYYVKLY